VEEWRAEDRGRICELKARYFRFVDTKEWDALRSLLTDDMTFATHSTDSSAFGVPITVGADDFTEYVKTNLANAVTVHYGHMPEIEFSGADEASAIWAMHDWVDDHAHNRAWKGYGHYYETYRRVTAREWRIASVKLHRLRIERLTPTRADQVLTALERVDPRGAS